MKTVKTITIGILLISVFFSFRAFADEQSITVNASGQGVSKTEALEDALRDAVRKVVGAYVVTQSTLKEDDFQEDIYINADAVVTSHKVIDSSEQDGIYSITIEASVVTNDLLKYIVKPESTSIASTDLANLLNRRKALSTAEKSLEYIFKDIGSKMYLAKRIGEFSLASSDRLDTDTITVNMRYSLQFNINEYKKFEKRLENLLSRVAIAEKSGQGTYDEIYRYGGFIQSFARSAQTEKWPEGTAIISFCDEYIDGEAKKYQYCIYAVPMQIYQKIDQLTPTYSILVFDFKLKGKEKPIKCYTTSSLAFFDRDTYGGIKSFEFLSWMKRNGDSFSQKDFTITFNFSEEQIRNMETCTIKIYTGNQASYLYYSFDKDEYEMKRLARNGYLPAMIAMVEQFDETKTWYHRAALLGSTHAQEKVEWENGGLGFEIIPSDNRFMVGTVRKGVPVNRGLYIKSINGTEFKYTGDRSIDELSNYIGKLSPETSVSVEFTNGNKIDVKVQEQ